MNMQFYSPHGMSAGGDGGDDIGQILQLWSMFSPEAQTMQQLHQAQAYQLQQQILEHQQADAYAQQQGFPNVATMQFSQTAKDRQQQQQYQHEDRVAAAEDRKQSSLARTAELNSYHDQLDEGRNRDSIALLSNLVETPEEKASLASAATNGKTALQDFSGQLAATRHGQQAARGFTGLLADPKQAPQAFAALSPNDWQNAWQYSAPGIWPQMAKYYHP